MSEQSPLLEVVTDAALPPVRNSANMGDIETVHTRKLTDAEKRGYHFTGSRPCRACGVVLDFYKTPAGKFLPINSSDGDDFVPACAGPAYGMTRLTERSGYLRDVVEALSAAGVAVEQIHPEYAAGQYEVSVAPEDPVAAADTFVLVRETIRAVSQNHDLRATFSPKVLPIPYWPPRSQPNCEDASSLEDSASMPLMPIVPIGAKIGSAAPLH